MLQWMKARNAISLSGILLPNVFYSLSTRSVATETESSLHALLPAPRGKYMKKQIEQPLKTEEGFELRVRPRDSKLITVHIPSDTLVSLEKIAAGRDMSVEALLKLYIGQAMRQDLAKLSADRVMEKTAQVLKQHIQSEAEVSAILKEIRVETVS